MNYLDKNLLESEKILMRTHRHWIVFAYPIFWLIVTVFFYFQFPYMNKLAIFPFVVAIVSGLYATIDYVMSEIAITNMRVLVKIGWLNRYSLETFLQNIASIQVEQPFLGRLLDYGTLIICDTGYMRTPFARIQSPLKFRRTVQSQINQRYPAPEKLESLEKESAE